MQGLSGPQEAGAWRFRRLAIAAALIVLLFAVVLLSPASPTDQAGSSPGSDWWAARLAHGGRLLDARRPDRRATARAGVDPVHHHRPARGGVQLSADQLQLASPNPNRTPSDIASDLGPRWSAIVGLAIFPLARRRTTDLGPDGPGRHRARRLGPLRRQRHRVPADPRGHRRQQRVQPGRPGLRRRHRHRGDPAVPARRTAGPTHPGPVRRRLRLLRRTPTSSYARALQ